MVASVSLKGYELLDQIAPYHDFYQPNQDDKNYQCPPQITTRRAIKLQGNALVLSEFGKHACYFTLFEVLVKEIYDSLDYLIHCRIDLTVHWDEAVSRVFHHDQLSWYACLDQTII